MSQPNPGAALKALRERMAWTLSDVAERTGLAVSTLSKIENNRVSLNFDKLSRLSTGLGIDIARFLDHSPPDEAGSLPGRRSTTRLGEGAVIETPDYRHVYHATDLLNKSFTPIVAEVLVRSREELTELLRHPGEEFVYVLEGAVEVHTDTYAPLLLQAGESVFFDSGMAHGYVAAAPGPCRVLAISVGSRQNVAPSATAPASGAAIPPSGSAS